MSSSDPFRDQLQTALGPGYTIERELTGGGMSHVFVATERALNRTVVVKVLKPELAAGVNRERFRREIMLVAQLQHPHIVPVLSAGEHSDLLWYTMPFVEGESLRESLARGVKWNAREVSRVLHDVLDALAYAHRRGIVHRDIKPGNILRHGAHSLVTDFGVAKALTAALPHSGTTSVGIAIGTPAYMAPEQLAADPSADHRMDLYAVGLLAYELLTGEQPFGGKSPQATMAAQFTRMPTPLEECCPGVPAPLSALVMRMLSKQPDDRPQSAMEALEELETFATPVGGGAAAFNTTAPIGARVRDVSPSGETVPLMPADAQSRSRRHLGAWIAAAGAIVGVGAVVIGISLARSRDRAAAPPPITPSSIRDTTPGVTLPAVTVKLTREDSLRIANAVRKHVADARRVDARTPGPNRDLDSLQRSLTRKYTDSAALSQRTGGQGGAQTGAQTGAQGGARVAGTGVGRAAASTQASTKPTRATTLERPTAPRAPQPARPIGPERKLSLGGKPLRVAVLPVRDATNRPDMASVARALEDSLRAAYTAAGYTIATDAELVRLLAAPDANAQRRIADAAGIGALANGFILVRDGDLVAQVIVLDVWRAFPYSERGASGLDDPRGSLVVVRDATRALGRVSWRFRDEPKRIVVYDLENQSGLDSLDAGVQALSDSLRLTLARRIGAQAVGDSAVRATRTSEERRRVGIMQSAGVIVAGAVVRARGDSVTARVSVRDMSEDRTFNNIELRIPRGQLMSALPQLAERLLDDIAKVNWGPKGTAPARP